MFVFCRCGLENLRRQNTDNTGKSGKHDPYPTDPLWLPSKLLKTYIRPPQIISTAIIITQINALQPFPGA